MAAASAVVPYLSDPARLQGVDLARGLAVLGMLAAHLERLPAWDWRDPATWTDVADGRSSILFATLAGASIALVTGGRRPLPGPALGRARGALAVRAVLLWLIGLLLIATHVPVFVILPAYALLFLLALPLLRLRARSLWLLAGVLAVVTPWVQPVLDALPLWEGESGATLALVVGWHYPAPIWATFLVAGLAAGRSDLAAPRTPAALLVGGLAVAALGYGAGAVTGLVGAAGPDPYLAVVLSTRPHSGGLWEVLGGGGFALAVIGLCLLACRLDAVAAVVFPLRAVGSMPLTAYAGQILVWALVAALVLGDAADLGGMRDLRPFWPFALGTILFCTAWAWWRGRGPLEGLLARVTGAVVRP